MNDQQIRIVLSASSQGFPAAAGAAEAGLNRVGAAAGRTTTRLQQAVVEQQRMTRQLSMVGPQLTDIVSGLASGQAPLTVLMQQGGQLRDMFGSWGGAARALGAGLAAMVTPVTVLTAGVAGFAAMAVKGYNQTIDLRDGIYQTGNFAGMTADRFEESTQRIKDSTGASIGSTREMAMALLESGKIGAKAFDAAAEAAVRMRQATGRSTDEVTQIVASMAVDAAGSLSKLNEQWHFLTQAQIEAVRETQRVEGGQAALVKALDLVNGRLVQHAENLGLIERAWRAVKGASSGVAEAMASIGRTATLTERLVGLRAELAQTQAGMRGMSEAWDGAALTGARRQEAALLRQIRDLEIEREDAAKRAGNRSYMAQQEQERASRLQDLKVLTDGLTGANEQYVRSLNQIQQAAEKGDITEERRLQLLTALANRYGQKATNPRQPRAVVTERAADDTDRLGALMAEASGREFIRRQTELESLQDSLVSQVQALNISLIEDDRERVTAQIELERAGLQARIDAMAAAGADVSQAQAALNELVLAKQRELNTQMQRQAEQNRSELARTWDGMAEDIFVTLGSGGKVNWQGMLQGLAQASMRDMWTQLKKDGGGTTSGAIDAAMERLGFAAKGLTSDFSTLNSGLGMFGNVLQTAAQAVLSLAASAGGSSGGGFLGSLLGMFNPGGTTTVPQSLTDMSASTVGMSLAVGTNRIPADGWKYLHKDEAVLPKAFNPWAGGAGVGGGSVVVNSPVNIGNFSGSDTEQARLMRVLDERDRRLEARLAEMLSRRGSAMYNAARA